MTISHNLNFAFKYFSCNLYLLLQEIDWYAHWTFGQMLGLWQSDCREMTVITLDGGDLYAKSSAQMDLLNADMQSIFASFGTYLRQEILFEIFYFKVIKVD